MIDYIKIIRPINLLIIAISQILIFLVYLFPLAKSSENMVLDGSLWYLFVIDTILIAAGGYVVNDLLDKKADAINKPSKVYVGKNKISATRGWIYYVIIVFTGFILALYIALAIHKLHLLLIYPFAVVLLFLYSWRLKRLPLLGNLVVSIFCAFVPGIIWYAEMEMINAFSNSENKFYELIIHLFPVYISFAFLSTMVREIIKDIEDMDGDMKSNFKTLPITAGPERAKIMAFFFGILLISSYVFWFMGFSTNSEIYIALIVAAVLILPTGYILAGIYRARSVADYSRISKMLKYLMIVSLFIFLCIPYIKN